MIFVCHSLPKKKKRKRTTCSKCDKKGHNSRTCRKTKVKKSLVQIIIISKMGRGPARGDYIFIFFSTCLFHPQKKKIFFSSTGPVRGKKKNFFFFS